MVYYTVKGAGAFSGKVNGGDEWERLARSFQRSSWYKIETVKVTNTNDQESVIESV